MGDNTMVIFFAVWAACMAVFALVWVALDAAGVA